MQLTSNKWRNFDVAIDNNNKSCNLIGSLHSPHRVHTIVHTLWLAYDVTKEISLLFSNQILVLYHFLSRNVFFFYKNWQKEIHTNNWPFWIIHSKVNKNFIILVLIIFKSSLYVILRNIWNLTFTLYFKTQQWKKRKST